MISTFTSFNNVLDIPSSRSNFQTMMTETFVKPFPTYSKSAADDCENIVTKTWIISIKDSNILK